MTASRHTRMEATGPICRASNTASELGGLKTTRGRRKLSNTVKITHSSVRTHLGEQLKELGLAHIPVQVPNVE